MKMGGFRYLLVALLLLGAALVIHLYGEIQVPLNRPLDDFPREIGRWVMLSEQRFDAPTLAALRPTDYLSRTYVDRDKNWVRFYIGYHGGGEGSGEIHSPRHCLPGSGWHEMSSVPIEMELGSRRETIVRAVYQKGETREIFFYWFQQQDQVVSNEYHLKGAQILSSLLAQRRDAAFIRISVYAGKDSEAAEVAKTEDFIRDVYPLIRKFLPQ